MTKPGHRVPRVSATATQRKASTRHVPALALTALLAALVGCSDAGPSEGTTSGGADASGVDLCAGIVCDGAADDACRVAVCDPGTGTCSLQPRLDGLGCDDGDGCTFGDRCAKGACVAGANLCSCASDADCADDADLCNGKPYCDTSTPLHSCKTNPATVVSCTASDAPCAEATCNPKTGTCAETPRPDGSPCDDGVACTVGDACTKGSCTPGQGVCLCSSDADCPDDADLCNGKPYCDPGSHSCKPNPTTVVQCDTKDDTACIHATCKPQDGSCSPAPAAPGTLCDDGDACTANDFCLAGSCHAGSNTCFCKSDAECSASDDGNLCNGVPYCDLKDGLCKPNAASLVVCPTVDDDACSKTVCEAKTGKCVQRARADVVASCTSVAGVTVCGYVELTSGAKPDAGPFACEDGSACTDGDACDGKACKPGTKVCACSSDADCAAQDDGDLCNGTLYCDSNGSKSCKANPASVVYCSPKDDTDCLKAACNTKTGVCALQPVAKGAPCDDDNPCTVSDACGVAVCVGGAANACDDGDSCTLDTCVPSTGCAHAPKVCNDGNDCTSEACSKTTGQCSAPTNLAKGKPCDADGSGCTAGDSCDGAGSCKAGAPVVCKQPTNPCAQAVCQSQGGTGYACVEAAKSDGTSCDDGSGCFGGATCKAGSCKVGDTPRIFVQAETLANAAVTLRGVAITSKGTIVAVGAKGTPQGKPTSWSWISSVRDANGTAQGIEVLADVPAHPQAMPVGVHNPIADTLIAVGTAGAASGADPAIVMRRLGADGKVLGGAVLASDGPSVAMASTSDTSLGVLVGGTSGSSPSWAILLRLDATGTLQKTVKLQQERAVSAIAVAGGQSIAVALMSNVGGGDAKGNPNMVMLDSNGKELWTVAVPVADARAITALIDLPGDSLIGLGHLDASVGGTTFSFRASSAASGSSAAVIGSQFRARRLLRGQKGTVYAVGDLTPSAASPGGRLVGLDPYGNVHWSTVLADDDSVAAKDAAIQPDGRVVVVGERTVQGALQGLAARTTAYGQTSCEAAGACLDKAPGSCDDGKACTTDGCDPLIGCVHDGGKPLNCAPTNGCSDSATCTAGACVPSVQGKLRIASIMLNGIGAWPFFDTIWDNDHVASYVGDPNTGTVLRLHVPANYGETTELEKVQPCMQVSVYTSIRHSDVTANAVLLAGNLIKGVDNQAMFCRTQAKATPYAVPAQCAGCTSTAVDVRELPNGGFWSLTRVLGKGKPIWMMRHTPDGYAAEPHSRGTANDGTLPTALVALSDGLGVAVGSRPSGGKTVGFALGVETGGDVTRFDTAITVPGSNVTLEAALGLANGDFVVGGMQVLNEVAQSHLVARLDAKGKVKWTTSPSLPDFFRVDQLVERSDGMLLGHGLVLLNANPAPFVFALEAGGNPLWSRTYPKWFNKQLTSNGEGLAVGPDGKIVVLAREFKGSPALNVIFADASGYANCKDAGSCAGKGMADCDDGKPCTLDVCDADLGCQHVPTSGVACGLNQICAQGSCVQP